LAIHQRSRVRWTWWDDAGSTKQGELRPFDVISLPFGGEVKRLSAQAQLAAQSRFRKILRSGNDDVDLVYLQWCNWRIDVYAAGAPRSLQCWTSLCSDHVTTQPDLGESDGKEKGYEEDGLVKMS
jgi:hypothetical protein